MDKKVTPIYFKIYNSDKIYKADKHKHIVLYDASKFDVVEIHDENPDDAIKEHRYGNRRAADRGWSIYLVKDGDRLFETLYDSKLARKIYPNAIPHDGYLLI